MVVSLTRLLVTAASLHMASPPPADTSTLRQEMAADIGVLERKLVSLAQAMDESQYDWTPMKGVRTVREVYLHIAANNYVFPMMTGTTPPADVPIDRTPASVQAFESARGSKKEVVRELQKSFRHLRAALDGAGDLNRTVDFFGRPVTARYVWLAAITHIHEHLGQAIAYARANHVVPPWSR